MSKGKIVAACLIWTFVVLVVAMAYKWLVVPAAKEAEIQQAEQKKQTILNHTGATSRYDHQLRFSLDSFSGYSIFRSKEFSDELSLKKIKLELVDDNADYAKRWKDLTDNKVQMAVFTIDALITASAESGELSASIIAIVDVSVGADAIVAFRKTVPNLDALNHPDTKFILPPDSPSETMARVVMSQFSLDNLGDNPFVEKPDAEAVYKAYRSANPNDRQVFVLWEPYVSKALENPNLHKIVDSSSFDGYIVDVIVANRNFLYANEGVAGDVLEAYLRARYSHSDNLFNLVKEDSVKTNTPVSDNQIKAIVDGILWKNTKENYRHFGIEPPSRTQHIEDMISNITKVLLKTGGISKDPTSGQPNLLYFPKLLKGLKDKKFHPGEIELVHDQVVLKELTEEQWGKLTPVGTLEVPPLIFPRGSTRFDSRSQLVLDGLVKQLETWPRYYIQLKGNASKVGDVDANKNLAQARAKAVADYLIQNGIHKNRIRAIGAEPSGLPGVTFVLGTNHVLGVLSP